MYLCTTNGFDPIEFAAPADLTGVGPVTCRLLTPEDWNQSADWRNAGRAVVTLLRLIGKIRA